MLAKKVSLPSVRIVLPKLFSTNSAGNEVVLTKEVNNNGLIIFNRPKALNSANLELLERYAAIVNDWKDNKSLIVARGNGAKAFSAGGDVRAMTENGHVYGLQMAKTLYQTLYHVNQFQFPFVALIDGIAMGTGLGLSAIHGRNARYRVATEKTVTAMPEAIIGNI